MKKIYLIIFSFICLFGCAFGVKANELNSINTTVYIDQMVTVMSLKSGTLQPTKEPKATTHLVNLEDREITNFTVSMDGTSYQYESTWNTSASKSAKSYKNGINYTEDDLNFAGESNMEPILILKLYNRRFSMAV